jgi:eukaryotic-like serine/threonine-protein kinase
MSIFPTTTPPPLANPASGLPRTIFDYDVIDQIGEGAASLIYAVSDPRSRQLYALKHVVRKTEKCSRFIEQLENEYEVGRRVTHPNLRRILDYKSSKKLLRKVNEAALIMELFDGLPLENCLPRQLPPLIQILIDTARGLEALHKQGFVHCDLKPSNILVNNASEVKVIDLGQACAAGTAKKRIQGTPDYIAPEQVKCLPVSFRTDIYNFGATMYWSLCGRKMPTLFTAGKGENSILSDDLISSPRQINPLVPETLSNFVMECTRSNPAKRPADMSEVIRRLEVIQHAVTKQSQARNSNVA